MGRNYDDVDFDASHLLDMMDEDVISYEYHKRGLEEVTEVPRRYQYSTSIQVEYADLNEDSVRSYFEIDQYDEVECVHDDETLFQRLTGKPMQSVEQEIKYDIIMKFIKERFFDLSIEELEEMLKM